LQWSRLLLRDGLVKSARRASRRGFCDRLPTAGQGSEHRQGFTFTPPSTALAISRRSLWRNLHIGEDYAQATSSTSQDLHLQRRTHVRDILQTSCGYRRLTKKKSPVFVFKKSPFAISCEPLLFRSFAESSREIPSAFSCRLFIPRTPSMFASAGIGLSETDHSRVLCRKVDLRASNAQQSSSRHNFW
jgi:hypothetical protein